MLSRAGAPAEWDRGQGTAASESGHGLPVPGAPPTSLAGLGSPILLAVGPARCYHSFGLRSSGCGTGRPFPAASLLPRGCRGGGVGDGWKRKFRELTTLLFFLEF